MPLIGVAILFCLIAFIAIYTFLDIVLNRRKGGKLHILRQYERIVKSVVKKNSLLKRIQNSIDAVITRSSIKRYLPFLDVGVFCMLSLVLFGISFFWLNRLGTLGALMYSCVAVYVPYSIMIFMSILNARKLKKIYINFLGVFSGFYNIEGNFINSLKSTAEYVEEPLKSILTRHTFAYERSLKGLDECFDDIIAEVGDRELRKFFKFAKLHSKYGGNFKDALIKLREQGEKLSSLEAMKGASSSVGTVVILLMILISIVMIFNVSNDYTVAAVLRNTPTGQLIAIANGMAIGFGFYMIRNINSTS